MSRSRSPDRGDAIWISLNPREGHEQGGRRPALVLSPASYNRKVGLAVICPITGQGKGYPFEVRISGGRQLEGVVLADQVRTVAWRQRGGEFIEQVQAAVIDDVTAKLWALVGDPRRRSP